MPRSVRVKLGASRYLQNISVGSHVFWADEPDNYGGQGEMKVLKDKNRRATC
jgi:hypothetical protein